MARTNRFLITLTALAMVFSACGDDTSVTTEAPTTTIRAAPVGDFADEMDLLIQAAEDVRGLEFLADPPGSGRTSRRRSTSRRS